jgi:hypothetical protein
MDTEILKADSIMSFFYNTRRCQPGNFGTTIIKPGRQMKIFVTFFAVIACFAFIGDEPVSKLNGSFRQVKNKYGTMKEWGTRDSITVIKVFRDGYWFAAFYDDKKGNVSFNGIGGGTYELKNGKYVEKVDYYSWDSTAVGNVFSFDYKISDNTYEQYGLMTSDKYKDYPINELSQRIEATEPLKNKGLEGVWFMKEGYWGADHRFGEGIYKNTVTIKIFNYPMVVYAYYNPITRQFQGGAGASYQFDGKTLTETNEFWSWKPDGTRKGFVGKHKITIKDGQIVQESLFGKSKEVFAKAK